MNLEKIKLTFMEEYPSIITLVSLLYFFVAYFLPPAVFLFFVMCIMGIIGSMLIYYQIKKYFIIKKSNFKELTVKSNFKELTMNLEKIKLTFAVFFFIIGIIGSILTYSFAGKIPYYRENILRSVDSADDGVACGLGIISGFSFLSSTLLLNTIKKKKE